METSPSVNSSIRSLLIAMGAIGVSKGWWDTQGLETLVDHLIVWGGASLTIGAAIWGILAKRASAKEAKRVALKVLEESTVEEIKEEVSR